MKTGPRILVRTSVGLAIFCLFSTLNAVEGGQAMRRAFDYLLLESTSWSPDNGCFSCHNDGDAFRALLAYDKESQSLRAPQWQSLLNWFQRPEEWLKSKSAEIGESPILTFIQFGTARQAAQNAGWIEAEESVERTIRNELLKTQSRAGYWQVEPDRTIGSPGTYGNALASFQALSIIGEEQSEQIESAKTRCLNWASQFYPKSSTDLAAISLLLNLAETSKLRERAKDWSQHLVETQNADGGWGIFPHRYSEVFDTAIACIAIAKTLAPSSGEESLKNARQFLEETQEPSGGWPETTRPSGGVSYAQHISTTAWALQALIQISESFTASHPPDLEAQKGSE